LKTSTTICSTIISEDDEVQLIDWSQIVRNLHSTRSLVKIAMKAGSTEQTLSNLKHRMTSEPKFSTGLQLLVLHGLEFESEHKKMGLG